MGRIPVVIAGKPIKTATVMANSKLLLRSSLPTTLESNRKVQLQQQVTVFYNTEFGHAESIQLLVASILLAKMYTC